MNKKLIEVVAGVIKKDNLYLLVQRPFKGEVGGKWEFPGGKIEKEESHQSALKRELNEELAIETNVYNHLMTAKHAYNTFDLIIHFYETTISSGEVILKEHLKLAWVKKEEIMSFDLAPADVYVLSKIS
jgi:8-oxo-dGTP diphosphatase